MTDFRKSLIAQLKFYGYTPSQDTEYYTKFDFGGSSISLHSAGRVVPGDLGVGVTFSYSDLEYYFILTYDQPFHGFAIVTLFEAMRERFG